MLTHSMILLPFLASEWSIQYVKMLKSDWLLVRIVLFQELFSCVCDERLWVKMAINQLNLSTILFLVRRLNY